MFVGWEGVGLCSYLLIGFWYEKKSASDAGRQGLCREPRGRLRVRARRCCSSFVTFGTLNFTEVFAAAVRSGGKARAIHLFGGEISVITLIALLLFLGATGKSAQLPLYVWLPDAMEGPTPVSALIHAATMVTAGVFMVARCAPIFSLSETAMNVVAIVGGLTAVFAATIGLVQNDIKRVIAYSTISQLGYMFLGARGGGLLRRHLPSHDACLLQGPPVPGLGQRHPRPLRASRTCARWARSSPRSRSPICVFIIGSLALAGIFPFAGFFSKDEILWSAYKLFGCGAGALDPRRGRRVHDGILFVPADLPDVLWQITRRPRG